MLPKKKVKKVEEGQLDYYKTFAMFLLSSAKCHFYFGFSREMLFVPDQYLSLARCLQEGK